MCEQKSEKIRGVLEWSLSHPLFLLFDIEINYHLNKNRVSQHVKQRGQRKKKKESATSTLHAMKKKCLITDNLVRIYC